MQWWYIVTIARLRASLVISSSNEADRNLSWYAYSSRGGWNTDS